MSRKVQQGKDRLLLVVMLIHLAVVLFWGISTEHIHTLWWGLGATIAAFAAFSFRPGTLFSRSVIAIGLVVFSAVLIHQSNGLIEWHFHIFAVLILLSIYYDWRVIVIAAFAVAVHHLIGLFSTLYSVYAPNPDLGIYSLHILFVALCASVLCYQCEVSVRNYKLINERNTQLKEAFDNIENKRRFGQKVSHTIRGLQPS